MRIRTLSLLGIACAGQLFGQISTSDCDGAIHLCGGIYTETSAPLGTGEVYEYTGACNASLETSSLWYTFTVQQDGSLSFVLDPANDADDYDWGLFNITTGGCLGINAQDGSSPEVNCNSYGLFAANGPTGISTANGGTGVTNGPGDLNGPPFNADLPVQAGQTYALVVMNWSGSQDGYTIDFTQSTAPIYDDVPPTVVAVVPDCSAHNFQVTFSEPIVTGTVAATDFTLTSPSGTVFPIGSVIPYDPNAHAQSGYTLVLNGVLTEGGVYTLTITSVSGNVEDGCGNLAVDTTFEFPVVDPLLYTVDVTTACNGVNGSLQATHVSGGTAPITFALGINVLPTGSATGLTPGSYVFHVADAAGCFLTDQVTIPDHLIAVSIPTEQDSLSCSTT
ncbi:MAG TPA: Ig-like domain-containing protein, partial [Flavobacteriales bacterium]|nr:Ig-like domain-containing protein [Flavobacteriales bacterium]